MNKTCKFKDRTAFFAILLFFVFSNSNATNYYLSTSIGDDVRSIAEAQNPNTPWKTIEKLNSVLNSLLPGDSVLFRNNDFFYGSLSISKSGTTIAPIVFSTYGTGNKATITGYTTIDDWTNAGGGIWETNLTASQSMLNNVLMDNIFRRVGRYPNIETSNDGFLKIDAAVGNSSITDIGLPAIPNWTNGEVVIRKARWVLDKNPIALHLLHTLSYNSQSGYGASAGYGYFIQNHIKTLDQDGEWYYEASSKKLGIFSSSGKPRNNSVKVSTVQTLVSINNQSNIIFSKLIFSGSNYNTFNINASQRIRISNCDLPYSGFNAINASNASFLTIENCDIYHANNIACNLTNCNNVEIKNNTIRKTGTEAGMGDGDSGSYEALLLSGNDQLIQGNIIDSTGYIPLTFSGNNITIKNNLISNYAFVKDDGGGIYTWNNSSNPPTNYGRLITGNIVLNGIGTGKGTPDPTKLYANGIYMDDNVGGVEISDNTVANCASYGLYIHNSHDLTIRNNLVYNNLVQLEMTHDDIAPYPITNVTLTGNSFVSKVASQSVAEFKTNGNDIANFGYFDNNYYSRPIDDNLQIGVLKKINGNYIWDTYDVESWKSIYIKDLNSKESPFSIAAYSVNNLVGNNLFSNGRFDNNINGLYAYSSANNASVSWRNGVLDGGALQVAFSNISGGANKASIIINVGSISANKKYLLKFTIQGTNEYKILETYLRYSNSPYSDIVQRNNATITSTRREHEILFSPTISESNASIGFDIPESNGLILLDNIQLVEANATITNPDDSIRFVYNPTNVSQSVSLDVPSVDIANNSYTNSINLDPYKSAVLLKKSGIDIPVDTVACSGTGTILREQWDNVAGNNIADIPLQTTPTTTSQINAFESATDIADNYAARIYGYLCPPQSGNYIFYIASDDASELWLSTDENPSNKIKIAYALSWTNAREWTKYASQKSVPIHLQAGHRYYVEALHKEGGGGDNLAVAWQLPNGVLQAPIPGYRLSPFAPTQLDQTINFLAIPSKTFGDAPFTLDATASSGLAVSLRVASGPATISGKTVTLTGMGVVSIEASQAGNALYKAAKPVMQSFTVSAPPATGSCSATGFILREQWNNIQGNDVVNIPLQNAPQQSMQLTIFEAPIDYGNNYGARIRGYICPPITGNYTFFIASDDASELWLSNNNNPNNKTKIAYSLSWTDSRQWYKFASQKSGSVYLEAGRQYYIEALHKEGEGGDNLAVAWLLPDGNFEAPIPGTRLSPFVTNDATVCTGTGNILREQWDNISGHNINTIPLQSIPSATSQLTVFESPTNTAENYGARISGFICAPLTGNYKFMIAGDDQAELWLSTNEDNTYKSKIAFVPAYTDVREWNKYPSQKSVDVHLDAGYKYYIEALQKEGEGGDNLAVAWQLPNGSLEAPIPGTRLLPYISGMNAKAAVSNANDVQFTITKEEMEYETVLQVYPNPATNLANVSLRLPEKEVAKIDLLDEQGRVLKNIFNGFIESAKTITVRTEDILNGMYIIRLLTPTRLFTKKIVIRR